MGYVANSPCTVKGESMSAGRIYDKIGDETLGRVKYKLSGAILGELVIDNDTASTDEREQVNM